MNWYLSCWTKSFDYKGRASRNEFWHFMLYACAICMIAYIAGGFLLAAAGRFLGTHARIITILISQLVSFVYFIHVFPVISVQTRRLHDIGKSGWWQAITIIALLSGITLQIALQLLPKGSAVPSWFCVPLLLLTACYVYLLALNCRKGDEGPNRYGAAARKTPDGH